MKIYAHRGASGTAPENTLEAFKLAIEMDVDGIETDIQMTKDGVLVLIHDERIDRTTNGSGYVNDYTYEELLQFNANNNMEQFNCKIPTLRQLLELIQDESFILHLELKTDKIRYEGIEQKVIELVNQYQLEQQVIYSSFNHQSLQTLKTIQPSSRICYTYDGVLFKPWRYCSDGIIGLHPRFNGVTKDMIDECILNALVVNVWTVNKEKDLRRMKELGVSGVFTNFPLLAIKFRDV